MSDQAVLALSSLSGDAPEQFQSKQWIFQNDQNGGVYNSQISIDATSFANSGRWINWSEAILTIPLVFGYKTSQDSTAHEAALGVGLKSGFHHLIHSFELQFGNTSVQQLTSFTNMFASFKMLTSFCEDTYHKFGVLLNFFKDSPRAYSYSDAASTRGKGVSCNSILPLAVTAFAASNAYPTLPNEGLLKRLYNTNLPATALTGKVFMSEADLRAQGVSHFKVSGSAAAAVYYSQAIATIRLKDISDFIAKLGLCKGAFIKLTINTNAGLVTANVGTSKALSVEPSGVVVQGGTFPVMCTSAETESPLAGSIGASGQQIIFGCGIQKLAIPGGPVVENSALSSCRLYVPAYTMMPEVEQGFLEASPVREIVYNDLYQFTLQKVSGDFNQLISNGIVGAQYVVVCPIVSASSNGTSGSVSPLVSPFTSEPATTSGGSWIDQYNVQVSGSNVYMQNIRYSWENFLEEVSSINALNGGQSDEMSSGLISYEDWSTIYKYYVTDVSRGTPMDMSVPKSIQIQGKVLGSAELDLFVFVVYKRRISIRTADSAIVM